MKKAVAKLHCVRVQKEQKVTKLSTAAQTANLTSMLSSAVMMKPKIYETRKFKTNSDTLPNAKKANQ